MKILSLYEKASGQAISLEKSKVFFSRNTPPNIKDEVTSILGVLECLGTRRYLGLSSMIGKKKKFVFNYLKDKIWKKINC